MKHVLDVLKDWQEVGEPYVKIVAPIAWDSRATTSLSVADTPRRPLQHYNRADKMEADTRLTKPIFLTVSTETLPVTIDGLSSSSITSLSSSTGGIVGLVDVVGSPPMEQLKAELIELRQQLARANTRYDVLL